MGLSRKPRGPVLPRARTWLSWLLLAVMFAGPFIRINGNPLLMINIVERKFFILGQIFWPQDNSFSPWPCCYSSRASSVFTAAFGRLVVRLDLSANRAHGNGLPEDRIPDRRRRGPATGAGRSALDLPARLAKKLFKHASFFVLSFIIGNTLLAYIIGRETCSTSSPTIRGIISRADFHGACSRWCSTRIFARFREQACTFICPYGRFQSTLLDENTIVVAYDYKRGEKRGTLQRARTIEQRLGLGQSGDCIDCFKCVTVCPTGIDIRNGTQMECVNCTACIDACDDVMDKIGRPRGLIRYASLNGIERASGSASRRGWWATA